MMMHSSSNGGDAAGAVRGLQPTRTHAPVPDPPPRHRTYLLQRIMKDQCGFLATKTQPTEDFGAGTYVV